MEEKGYEILSDDLAMVPMTTTRLTDPDQLKLCLLYTSRRV